ncbi:hypothetical protein GONAM_06_01210 [Gordonia namibiensis NBRC 108229]|uniref:Uncharacterized protein n=1 Tax=Gordonia namibiensis NBRC 108229 TaxID=1208314 RepID=K6WYX4_9ACTN|nr:hypothetical protein [Gordonia namibiensis]GAB99011.1 hypothetical protein GONAM_06_01210 [Gordonia namibiensis NBRC 108229]
MNKPAPSDPAPSDAGQEPNPYPKRRSAGGLAAKRSRLGPRRGMLVDDQVEVTPRTTGAFGRQDLGTVDN